MATKMALLTRMLGRGQLPPLGTERAGATPEGRPFIKNPGGSYSTERSVTVPVGHEWMNIPSMFNGKQVSPDQATEIMRRNGFVDPETGRISQNFPNLPVAVEAAKARSASIPTPTNQKPAPDPRTMMQAKMRALAQMLARAGQQGDTKLAHINPEEARLLKSRGGAGTPNPMTGLPQYAVSAKGDKEHGGAVGSGGGKGRGGTSGSGSGSAAKSGGPAKGRGSLGSAAPNAPISERQAVTRAAFNNAMSDYGNYGNSFGEDVAGFVAGLLGAEEKDPAKQGMGHFDPGESAAVAAGGPAAARADWGLDALGLGLSGLGMATGVPLGTMTSIARALGILDEDFGVVNMGPDFFGGSTGLASAPSGPSAPRAGLAAAPSLGGRRDRSGRTGSGPTPGRIGSPAVAAATAQAPAQPSATLQAAALLPGGAMDMSRYGFGPGRRFFTGDGLDLA